MNVRVDLAGIVADAKAVGALLYTKNGGLFAGNSSVVSGELRQRLLDNKSALIEFLTPKPLEAPAEPTPFEIEIYIKGIGGDDVNAVNARELWAKLESKQQFADWIKNRIEKWGFKEETDFNLHKFMKVQIEGGREVNREVIDYFISLDMAKQMAMVENNAQGQAARRYFIECEKVAKSAGTTKAIDPTSPEVRQTMWKAREFGRLSGASKRVIDEYVNKVTEAKHGIRPIKVVTGERHEQLNIRIMK